VPDSVVPPVAPKGPAPQKEAAGPEDAAPPRPATGTHAPVRDAAHGTAFSLLRVPLKRFDARGACLVTLTVLAVLFAMREGREFLVPLVVAIIAAYALDPLVAFLERRRIPRLFATVLVMGALIGIVVFGVLTLQNQVADIVNTLPRISHKLSRTLSGYTSGGGSVLEKLRGAAAVFQEAPKNGGSQVVVSNGSAFDNMLLAGSMSIAAFLGETVMIGFLVFFLLVAGNTFKRKFVKVAGHSLTEKKINVHMLDEINRSIQRYLLMMVVTNVLLGLLTWGALRLIGLENAGTWAVVAGALHIIPYFGPLLTALCTGVAALVQFGLPGPALLTAAATLAISAVIGVAVTTWMTGRIAKMNTVSVFIVLLLFTWVWGVWGTLLSIPIAVIAKVVADHVEGLHAVAEFLGE
jgi:predicted PurR-regulated permease PerM